MEHAFASFFAPFPRFSLSKNIVVRSTSLVTNSHTHNALSLSLCPLQLVMSSALETLLEAARYIELQEERERLTSTSSSASSLSTSPYSNSRYQPNYVSHSLVSTPPASPLSDGARHHSDYASSNGSTIVRNGKLVQIARILIYLVNFLVVIEKLFADVRNILKTAPSSPKN